MRTRIEVFVALCLIALATSYALKLQHYKEELADAQQVRDSLLMDVAAANAVADGWAVRFGEMDADLRARIARRDSMMAALAGDLDAAHARIRTLVGLVATLKDSLTSVGAPGDTTEAGDITYTGQFDDGLLNASWRFLAPSLSMTYGVTVPLEIVTSESAGRWLVTARSDPRVKLTVSEFWFEPPKPLSVCTLGQKAKWLGYGGVLGGIAVLVAGH